MYKGVNSMQSRFVFPTPKQIDMHATSSCLAPAHGQDTLDDKAAFDVWFHFDPSDLNSPVPVWIQCFRTHLPLKDVHNLFPVRKQTLHYSVNAHFFQPLPGMCVGVELWLIMRRLWSHIDYLPTPDAIFWSIQQHLIGIRQIANIAISLAFHSTYLYIAVTYDDPASKEKAW